MLLQPQSTHRQSESQGQVKCIQPVFTACSIYPKGENATTNPSSPLLSYTTASCTTLTPFTAHSLKPPQVLPLSQQPHPSARGTTPAVRIEQASILTHKAQSRAITTQSCLLTQGQLRDGTDTH